MSEAASTAASVPARRTAAVTFIFVAVVIDVMSFGIIIPVWPKLVESFLGGDTQRASEILGYFGFAWAIAQFVCAPVQGALSDRFGRRPVLLFSIGGLGIDFLIMALAPDLWWLFVGRVLSGMTAASFSTANAYIADVTPPDKRAAAFGMMGAAFGLGFVLGPALGGVLGDVDPRLPFFAAAGMASVNAIYGFFILPESLPRERRMAFSWRRANPLGALKLLRSHHELFGLAFAQFLYMVAHNVLPVIFVLYASYRYDWNATMVGLTLAGVGILGMIVQGGLVGPIVRRLGERRSMAVGLVCGAIGFLIYGLGPTGEWMWAGAVVAAFWGLYGPSVQAIMTRRVGPSEQGQLQGANGSIMGLASLIPPLLYTQIFAAAIAPDARFHFPGAPFVLAASLLVFALIVAWRATRPR